MKYINHEFVLYMLNSNTKPTESITPDMAHAVDRSNRSLRNYMSINESETIDVVKCRECRNAMRIDDIYYCTEKMGLHNGDFFCAAGRGKDNGQE